jgi:hypothetical protein
MSFQQIRWREFIAALGSVAAWPPMSLAQQPERMRYIGVLLNATADLPVQQPRVCRDNLHD